MNFIKNINWSELATKEFWFYIDRATIHFSEMAFVYLAGILIVLGIIFILFARFTKNKFLALAAIRFAKIFFTIGILEGIWFGLRYQYAQVLGTKFVAALIVLWGLVWLYWPIKYLLTNYKIDMAEAQRAASRDKYLNRN